MSYWINSNSGDYISFFNGVYTLNLIPRYNGNEFLKYERIEITSAQFMSIKGFIPIKAKKLFGRKQKNYAPTLSDGSKGESTRVSIPSKSDAREDILKQLGL